MPTGMFDGVCVGWGNGVHSLGVESILRNNEGFRVLHSCPRDSGGHFVFLKVGYRVLDPHNHPTLIAEPGAVNNSVHLQIETANPRFWIPDLGEAHQLSEGRIVLN